MTRKTCAAYLIQRNPGIAARAQDDAAPGVAKPYLWAEAEPGGEDAYAACLFGHVLRGEIAPPGDHARVDAAREGGMNIDSEALQQEVADTMRCLAASGIDVRRLTPLVQAIQTQTVRQVADVLDERPERLGMPLPDGRHAGWGVFRVNPDDTVGDRIGVRAVVNDPGRL